MSSFKVILSTLVICCMPAIATATDAPASFTDAQKAAIENIVRELLTKKEPDIIIRAAQEIQNKMDTENSAKNQEGISKNRDRIFNDPNSPVGGNAKGNVTVVEFLDYQCGYCKISQEAVQKLLETDKNVKVIYKEFPILGDNSVKAAKAALASVRQGKYQKFHEAMLTNKDQLSDETIFKIAKSVGLDTEKLKKDMEDPAIEKMIKANYELGNDIGARGTPTFIIGEQLYPGALQYDSLKKAVEDARAGTKK